MQYLSIPGNDRLFVLFHGTGGNDTSLLSLTGEWDPEASVLSFTGDVGSGRNRRFFAPLVNRQVNRDDLEERVQAFLIQWDQLEALYAGKEIILVGYSNGANFLLALLEERPDLGDITILLHPSDLGWRHRQGATRNRLILTLGANDYIAPPGLMVVKAKQWEAGLFPQVTTLLLDGDHAMSAQEVSQVKAALNSSSQ